MQLRVPRMSQENVDGSSHSARIKPDVGVDNPNEIVLRITPATNEIVNLRVDAYLLIADYQVDVFIGVISDQFANAGDCGIVRFRDCKEELETRVSLSDGGEKTFD